MTPAAKENEQLLNEILVLVNRLKIRNLLYTQENDLGENADPKFHEAELR
jgi:hypothetical protein